MFNARVVGLGVGDRDFIDTDTLNILTGPPTNQFIILTFSNKKTCTGGGGDSDDEDDADDDDGSDSDGGGGSCTTELSRTASLICG